MVQGIQLFAVGMITVFGLLALVVLSGQFLIRLVNRFSPDTAKQTEPDQSSSPVPIAAIVGAVEVFTQGTGRVTAIEKVSP